MSMLEHRRAVVIGTQSPLGALICRALADEGADVVGIDHRPDRPIEPSLRDHIVADMTDTNAAKAAIRQAGEVLGAIDAVVSGAAVQRGGAVWEMDDEDWNAVISGTLTTTRNALRFALPVMTKGGAIVALSSVNATLHHPHISAYSAAKGAVDALVRQTALDVAPRGIRVNAVAPAYVDGDAHIAAHGYPLGYTPTSAHVAGAVAFLLSERAAGITGVILPVDAGLSTVSAATSRPELRALLFDE